MPTTRFRRRLNALGTVARQHLRQKTVRAEYERDALIAAIGEANGGRQKEIRLPLARFFFPTAAQVDQHLEIEVDDEASEVVFRVVKGDADDTVLVEQGHEQPDEEPNPAEAARLRGHAGEDG